MDSPVASPVAVPAFTSALPGWALPRGREPDEFAAGIALRSLDDLVRSAPVWAGCWRARQTLNCAAVAVRLMGRSEDEPALPDAVLLTAAVMIPARPERCFWPPKEFPPANPPFPRKRWPNLPIFSDLPGTID